MNVKKLLLSVGTVLAFTIIFLLCFQHCAKATEVSSEILEVPSQDISDEESQESIKDELEVESEEHKPSGKEIGIYIKEKILPVVVGVLTSVSALLATLVAIKRSLGAIGQTKDDFKKEAKRRDENFKEQSEYLNEKAKEIERTLALVPQLSSEITKLEKDTASLIKECTYLSKMITLGFSQSEDVISSGNGEKIKRLYDECQRIGKAEEAE